MESFNQVILSGVVNGHALLAKTSNGTSAIFEVETTQMYRRDGEKAFEPEIHVVKMKDAGTIAKYLTDGKPILVVGRLKPSMGTAYVNALHISFPDRRMS